MNDLAETFVDAIDHLDLPEADLVVAVLARIDDTDTDTRADTDADATDVVRPESPVATDRSRRRSAVLVGAALVIVAATMAATPVGEAVADWLGIGSTAFKVDVEPPAGDQTTTNTTTTNTTIITTVLGDPVIPPPEVVPIGSLGQPDAVFDDPRRGRTFVWDAGAGTNTDTPIRLSVRVVSTSSLSIKSLASIEDVEFLTIDAETPSGGPRPMPAAWVGAPHTLTYPVDGLDLELTVDAGPVLIWVDGDVEFRLEGMPGKAQAVALAAESLEGTELVPAE